MIPNYLPSPFLTHTPMVVAFLDRFLQEYKVDLGPAYENFRKKVTVEIVNRNIRLYIGNKYYDLPLPTEEEYLFTPKEKLNEMEAQWILDNIVPHLTFAISQILNSPEHQALMWEESLPSRLRSYVKPSVLKDKSNH